MKRSELLALSLILILVGVLVGVWIWQQMPVPAQNPAEIREYDGQALNSVSEIKFQGIAGFKEINVSTYNLTVTGLVENETAFTYGEIVNEHGHQLDVVVMHCVEGWQVKILWEGVLVRDLLEEAGYDRSAQVLILYSADGFTTSLPVSYVVGNNVTMAFKANGLTLPKSEGYPFRLIAPGKLGYKWAKWVTKMEVSNDTSFRGFWESRGYSNDADWP